MMYLLHAILSVSDKIDQGSGPSFETILSAVSIFITLVLGVGVFLNARRTNRTGERKLTVDEQIAEDEREDVIAKRRREELDRLYERVKGMEATIESMEGDVKEIKADRDGLKKRVEAADRREELLFHHVSALRVHIINGNPPPPPTMPTELVAWFEEFERTDPGLQSAHA